MNRKTIALACLSIFLLVAIVSAAFAETLPIVTTVEV